MGRAWILFEMQKHDRYRPVHLPTIKWKFSGRLQADRFSKGIGPYTAAAIASFAYKLPYAVVDGNVKRVLARFFKIEISMDSRKGKNTPKN